MYLKTADEIKTMRRCGQLVCTALNAMAKAIVPGKCTTADLDAIGEEVLLKAGAKPSFKGHRGFPAAVCISVNNQVVHGIPGKLVLNEGDIVSLDIGSFIDGYHGDGAWTYPVGEIKKETQKLLDATRESLYLGIEEARAGNRLGDIGNAIQSRVEKEGYSVVRDLVGHGIGRKLWEEPTVPNYGRKATGMELKAGMTMCIEPMINVGKHQVRCLDDHWTVVTEDGSLSAHFEHMVYVTEDSPEILTIMNNE